MWRQKVYQKMDLFRETTHLTIFVLQFFTNVLMLKFLSTQKYWCGLRSSIHDDNNFIENIGKSKRILGTFLAHPG